MHHSKALIKNLTTVSDMFNAIEAIEGDISNYPKAEHSNFRNGQKVELLSDAKKKIALLNKHIDKMIPDEDEEQDMNQDSNEQPEQAIRAYLRASTKEQDANRAKSELEQFAKSHGKTITAYYSENKSGAKLDRPELFRLIEESNQGDIILVESCDRLSRLKDNDLKELQKRISDAGLHIVVADVATTHQALKPADKEQDSFVKALMSAINNLVLEIAFAAARKDYELRRKRQAQGIETAKAKGIKLGRKEDADAKATKQQEIIKLLLLGRTYDDISKMVGVSKSFIVKVKKQQSQDVLSKAKAQQTANRNRDFKLPTADELKALRTK